MHVAAHTKKRAIKVSVHQGSQIAAACVLQQPSSSSARKLATWGQNGKEGACEKTRTLGEGEGKKRREKLALF